MSDKYILRGKDAVPCDDLLEWGRWFETADRKVALDYIGTVRVSTVFIGLNHNFLDDGPPHIFETMVFGGEMEGECARYSTWEEAESGHRALVTRVEEAEHVEKTT